MTVMNTQWWLLILTDVDRYTSILLDNDRKSHSDIKKYTKWSMYLATDQYKDKSVEMSETDIK